MIKPAMPLRIPDRPDDTSSEAELVQVELLRAMAPADRLLLAVRLTSTVVAAAKRALAELSPAASKRDRDVRFVSAHYGDELAEQFRRYLDQDSDERPRS